MVNRTMIIQVVKTYFEVVFKKYYYENKITDTFCIGLKFNRAAHERQLINT